MLPYNIFHESFCPLKMYKCIFCKTITCKNTQQNISLCVFVNK